MKRTTFLIHSIRLIALSVMLASTVSAGPENDLIFQEKGHAAVEFRNLERQAKSGNTAGLDADSTHSWDALHYDIELGFFPTQNRISGTTTITGKCVEAAMDSVPLHFHPGMTIIQVTCAGQEVGYSWISNDLTVELDRVYAVNDTFEVAVTYDGTPGTIVTPLWPMGISWGNVIWSFTDPEGARIWYPCFDKPFDKATYSARYTVPEGWITASNGALDSTVTAQGRTITYWNHPYQIETYLISIAISNYSQFSDSLNNIPFQYYVYTYHLGAAQIDFQPLPDMMQNYVERFGEYPFEKYGMAEAPIGGGMEHQTMTTIGDMMITGTGYGEFIFTHELSHMWWGDAVSLIDWPHMWLNEGFATYSEAIWAEYRYGWDYFLYYVQNYIQNYYLNWENPSNRNPTFNPPPTLLFSPLTYEKPGSVLHMLRHMMGDEVFFATLQDYYTTYKYGLASSQDFQDVAESHYGDDLDWFFQQWIYEEGYPVFEYFYTMNETSPGVWDVSFAVTQTQEEQLPDFITMVDIGMFIGGVQQETITDWIYSRNETFEFQYSGPEPDSIVFDPDVWILGPREYREDITEPVLSYQGHEWVDGFALPGTEAELFIYIQNIGLPTGEVFGALTTSEPLTPVNASSSFGSIAYNQTAVNQTPFSFQIPATIESHWGDFELALTGGIEDTTFYISIPLGAPNILFVDDDMGASSDIPAKVILDSVEAVYYHWDVSIEGVPTGMSDYPAVVWACGHATETLNQEEMDSIAAYLDIDGRLFISGSNIASQLQGNSFLYDYLHLEHHSQTSMVMINGVDDDPVGDGLNIVIASNPPDQDQVNPVNGGIASFEYLAGNGAGIRYEDGYKIFTFTFAFEDMRWDLPSANKPYEIVESVFDWLDFGGVVMAPELLIEISGMDVVLTWNTQPSISEYNIYRAEEPYAEEFQLIHTQQSTTYTDTARVATGIPSFYEVTGVY